MIWLIILFLERIIIWFVKVWINLWLWFVKIIDFLKFFSLLLRFEIDFKFKWFVGLLRIRILDFNSINFESIMCIFLFLDKILIDLLILFLEKSIWFRKLCKKVLLFFFLLVNWWSYFKIDLLEVKFCELFFGR